LGVTFPLALYTPPMWGIPEREMRRRRAETPYELEVLFAEAGWHSEEFVYDGDGLHRVARSGSFEASAFKGFTRSDR
jgi:hypothetical protein